MSPTDRDVQDGDECKAVERQALQAWTREFKSLHPCQRLRVVANVAERIRREIVALVDAGSSPVVRPSFRDGVTGNTPGSELGD